MIFYQFSINNKAGRNPGFVIYLIRIILSIRRLGLQEARWKF
jgi:hypothetical protein